MTLEFFDGVGQLPLYDQDLDTSGPPPAVIRLREAVRAADGLVIVTPEYNHTIPAATKNAVDWASRPMRDMPLTGKGVVVQVATPGRALGFRGLSDLVLLLTSLGNMVVTEPEVVINSAYSVLGVDENEAPRLNDPVAEHLIRVQLKILADLIDSGAPAVLPNLISRHWDTRFAGGRG